MILLKFTIFASPFYKTLFSHREKTQKSRGRKPKNPSLVEPNAGRNPLGTTSNLVLWHAGEHRCTLLPHLKVRPVHDSSRARRNRRVHSASFTHFRDNRGPTTLRKLRVPMQNKRHTTTHPNQKMVRSTFNNRDFSRFITVRVNFHRDVLCVHFVLGIQDLLCLRIYVTGLFDSGDCDDLREYCLHLFLVEQ